MKRTIALITAEIGQGAQITGCLRGPQALLAAGIAEGLRGDGGKVLVAASIRDMGMLEEAQDDAAESTKMAAVRAFAPTLAEASRRAANSGDFPLVLGGDHSCAIGTWSGIAEAYRHGVPANSEAGTAEGGGQGGIGLIWIDAHLDSHTPETSESQAPHGMPLAALLGEGDRALTDLFGWRGKIRPEHAVVLGARSFEAGEARLLKSLGVRVMLMDEVGKRGMAACLDEAIRIASKGTVGYGVSFDLDVIDPLEAPGVGSPAERGIGVVEAVDALRGLHTDPKLIGFEFVEYNPDRDDENRRTANVCRDLLLAALRSGSHGRRRARVAVTAPIALSA